MTSQGQRFRRRALRRGYKVDEVDAFLDRVEATLAGDPIGAPVSAQEVHDVVFRVRFGGYDEWQVDLHLDRVERQLADAEERGGFGRGHEPRMGMRDSGGLRVEDRMPPMRDDRMGPPPRDMGPPPVLPTRTPMASNPMGGPPMSGAPMMGNPMGGPPMGAPPPMAPPPMAPPPMPAAPMSAPPRVEYPRFDDTAYTVGGFGDDFDAPYEPPPALRHPSFDGMGRPPGHNGPGPSHNAPYDAPGTRHGRMDMTTELRMPHDMAGAPTSGMPMSSPYDPYDAGPPPPAGPEVQRVDAMRRTFTPRRFGSGYDAVQVNRLFDAIIASLSGRTSMPISENELDPNQFSLVPGGYFEAEVNQALREVRDLMARR